ncbi:hypothetical protein [Lentibacillus cibarius]|uniref:Uncharacterized protein n=1 Tax=Lentibacillus cibarius TaxID=2583219 RepID=A0A5S3QJT1_9BACI|nr:hypothetical protein [Lentibacillus cibarius]TMN21987.1 hypothetical protein FFL34_07550 [Lentibacillus cibarius]
MVQVEGVGSGRATLALGRERSSPGRASVSANKKTGALTPVFLIHMRFIKQLIDKRKIRY